jgi:hypothetical protein
MPQLNEKALAALVDDAAAAATLAKHGYLDLPISILREINELPPDQARRVLLAVYQRAKRNMPLPAAPAYAHRLANRRRQDRLLWILGIVGIGLYIVGKLTLYGVGK